MYYNDARKDGEMVLKKLIKIILFLIIVFPFGIKAEEIDSYDNWYTCDFREKARLISIASNLALSTDYFELNNMVEFSITISNPHPDIYIVDTIKNENYYYDPSSANPAEIKITGYKDGITVKYEIHSVDIVCMENLIMSKYVTLPPYNQYYKDPICKDIPDFSLCKKWVKVNYTYDEFIEQVEKYKAGLEEETQTPEDDYDGYFNELIEIFIKYYIYILPIIIILGIVGINILKRRKEFRF